MLTHTDADFPVTQQIQHMLKTSPTMDGTHFNMIDSTLFMALFHLLAKTFSSAYAVCRCLFKDQKWPKSS
jgi:hypothetical protein